MTLVKHRQYGDIVTTNQLPVVGTSVSPLQLATYSAPTSVNASFLRLRFDFSISVQIGATDPPPEIWWPVTQVLVLAFWNDSGSTVVGPSFGTSEHFLGSRLLSPVLTRSVTAPTTEYVVTYTMREPLVADTARKGTTPSTPRVNLGMTLYDPYSALDGTYTSVGVNWQGHTFILWGDTF